MVNTSENMSRDPVMSGDWGVPKWEFFLADNLPEASYPCTAAAVVVARNLDPSLPLEDQEVVLTSWADENDQSGRAGSWEILCGHADPIDPEDPNSPLEHPWEAIKHEAPEEGGVEVRDDDPHGLVGYLIITNPPGSEHPEKGIMPYYWLDIGNQRLVKPTDTEYNPMSGTFRMGTLEVMATVKLVKPTELEFIRYALQTALRTRKLAQ